MILLGQNLFGKIAILLNSASFSILVVVESKFASLNRLDTLKTDIELVSS